ncbi:MAG: UDP-N-acetylmuramate--L-alanine ligase [Rickettsiaceae bacterium]|nr:UDP-N-acetylmuramate--L-alanine ligase [Rickettsiaceae bacterium]
MIDITLNKLMIEDHSIHFIGIGGIGMSAIAQIMCNLGYKIQGSDLVESKNTARLRSLGIDVFIGHDSKNIDNAEYVVISSDVKDSNIEVLEARRKKIPILKRSEILAELMRFKTSIAVSGSHGKTTTTAILATMFEAANIKPTVINGGIINNVDTNAYLGSDSYLIAEADESDATFVNIPATIAVITNINFEHLSFYHNFDNLLNAFEKFITNLPFYGFAVVCFDNLYCRQLAAKITNRKILTYSIESDEANVKAFNIKCDEDKSIFDVCISLPGQDSKTIISNVMLPTAGLHNVLNSLSAIAIAAQLNFGFRTIQSGFKNFRGNKRRFTRVGEYNGALIIDDYAHHPVEIKATLATAQIFTKKYNSKIIVVFQPHRYSRFASSLYQDFVNAFESVEILCVTEIYAAGEEPIANISSEKFVQDVIKATSKTVFYANDIAEITNLCIKHAKEKDMILFLGAGSISSMCYEVHKQLIFSSTPKN